MIENLSPHVWFTSGQLVHLVTRRVSDAETPPSDFMYGNEKELIHKVLMSFEHNGMVKIYYVPTWNCPCQCGHCYVRHQVNAGAVAAHSDESKVISFLDGQAANRNVKTVSICFIGGEPTCGINSMSSFLRVCEQWCRHHGVHFATSITTSLPMPLSDDDIDFLSGIDRITVSIDGNENSHDAAHGVGMYACAIRNLARLCRINDHVSVQATLSQSDLGNQSIIDAFFYAMHVCGVPPSRLQIGGMAATKATSSGVVQINGGYTGFSAPCCCYRFMSLYVIHGNQIYANLFNVKSSSLGSMDSDYSIIKARYIDYLTSTMAVLTDPVCIMCPVLGLCWGRCYGDTRFRNEPWRNCNRENLQRRIGEMADSGKLIEALHGWTPNWYSISTEF